MLIAILQRKKVKLWDKKTYTFICYFMVEQNKTKQKMFKILREKKVGNC